MCFFTAFDANQNGFEKELPDIHVEAILVKPMTISELAIKLDGIIGDGDERMGPMGPASEAQ